MPTSCRPVNTYALMWLVATITHANCTHSTTSPATTFPSQNTSWTLSRQTLISMVLRSSWEIFNLHWNDVNDMVVNSLKSFLLDFNLIQIRDSPTHIKGATLDLVIGKPNSILLDSILPCDWTDHYCVTFLILDLVRASRSQPKNPK